MSIDDIVDMVAVRNCVMSTLSAVGMARVVSGARMGRRAASRIRLARGENVLVDVSVVDMMQVPVVKIVLVAIVFDGLVPAAGLSAPLQLTIARTRSAGVRWRRGVLRVASDGGKQAMGPHSAPRLQALEVFDSLIIR
jgi:hypothetical protein